MTGPGEIVPTPRNFPDGKSRNTRRRVFGTAIPLVAFIMLPSALLGFLSWRAIENERSYALERLQESYQQFARLASSQIDRQLREAESEWAADMEQVANRGNGRSLVAELARRTGKQPLIADYFLLSLPDRIVYPPVPLAGDGLVKGAWEADNHLREHETFNRLVTRGEELEYRAHDLEGAIAAYRQILGQVSNASLLAMAQSYIGRAQLKKGEHSAALSTFREILVRYPEARDLNRMYLRFLAQYQVAVALENLWRYGEAVDVLLELNRDLLRRSDAITTTQYSYYSDLIQTMMPRLLARPGQPHRARYAQAFRALTDQSKKRISQRYFAQLLEAELNELVIRRRHYNPGIHYLSARAEGDPFLLAYRQLPDAGKVHVTGILAVQIDLVELREQLLSASLRNLQPEAVAALAIRGSEEEIVIGTDGATGTPITVEALSPPFDFWEVAVYLRDVPGAIKRLDLRATLWMWLVSLLLLSILVSGYVFVRRMRREAYLARAQSNFVSNVTHELRTPLSSIRMFAELLEMRTSAVTGDTLPEFKGNAGQYLDLIRRESDRLTRLIERVLDVSRMERRTKRYRFGSQSLGAAVVQAVESFRPHAELNGFSLGLTVEEALPDVNLDADAFSQVVLNLLTNAFENSEDVKEIRVRVHRAGERVAVAISDRGVGIERARLARIFERFHTGPHGNRRPQGGLGLGLTLSREIVRAHGGEIRVESEVRKGSTFTVFLPVTAAEALAPAETGETLPALRSAADPT